jgi:hypothetical protein
MFDIGVPSIVRIRRLCASALSFFTGSNQESISVSAKRFVLINECVVVGRIIQDIRSGFNDKAGSFERLFGSRKF